MNNLLDNHSYLLLLFDNDNKTVLQIQALTTPTNISFIISKTDSKYRSTTFMRILSERMN